jgi:hypothetical protein
MNDQVNDFTDDDLPPEWPVKFEIKAESRKVEGARVSKIEMRTMASFDGEYNGLLVRDWRDEEWARYYHDYYAPIELEEDGKNNNCTKQLFCGPNIELTDELFETVNSEDGHINYFDAPICQYRACGRGLAREEVQHYFENYPYPPVYERFMVSYNARLKIAEQEAEANRDDVYERYSLNNLEELERHISGQCWSIRKGYNSSLDKIQLRQMLERKQQLLPREKIHPGYWWICDVITLEEYIATAEYKQDEAAQLYLSSAEPTEQIEFPRNFASEPGAFFFV